MTSSPHSAAPETPDPRRWLALAVILSATLLSVIDFLIVNIALPSIRGELGASDAQVQLTVAGYGLAFAVCLITGGRLGDIFGHKRIFQIGMAGFTLASAACGFSQTPLQLVGFRVVQGAFAAMMSPQVLATIQVMFAGAERDTATGMVGAAVGIGSFLGNVLGGYLVGANLFGLQWRPIFFVNVPIGLIALVLAQALVRESKSPTARRLDIPGSLLSGLVLFLLIFPLAEGRERGWPWWAFAMIGLSALGLWGFVRYETALSKRHASPLVDMELLRNEGFGRGLIGLMLLFAGISSFALTLTLFLQDGLGVAPQRTGLIFAALSLSFFVSSLNTARFIPRLGARLLLVGLTIMQLGQVAIIAALLLFGGKLNPLAIVPLLFFYGIGQGLCVPQFIRQTLNHVGAQNAGAAAGVLNSMQQVGATLGVSLVGGAFFAFAERGGPSGGGTPDSYARALAVALACNFGFVLLTTLLVRRSLHQTSVPASAAPAIVEIG